MTHKPFPYTLLPETLDPKLISGVIETSAPDNLELYFLEDLQSKDIKIDENGVIVDFDSATEDTEELDAISIDLCDTDFLFTDFTLCGTNKTQKNHDIDNRYEARLQKNRIDKDLDKHNGLRNKQDSDLTQENFLVNDLDHEGLTELAREVKSEGYTKMIAKGPLNTVDVNDIKNIDSIGTKMIGESATKAVDRSSTKNIDERASDTIVDTKDTTKSKAERYKTRELKIKYAINVPTDLVPQYEPIFTFSYKPDPFQLQSFYFLHNSQSIFVSAHTAAGKTTILHYCIHLAKLNKTRVIYTSPIKALSNQKYNELKEYNPGIITGDISINKDSDVLIVTTEILRNLLYTKNPLLSNLEFVIFDEVHYVSDRERGVVWEECIIFMPGYVTIAMLSACVENDYEFASWVGRLRKSTVYIIRTNKRPVPLEYYMVEDEAIKPVKTKNAPKSRGECTNESMPACQNREKDQGAKPENKSKITDNARILHTLKTTDIAINASTAKNTDTAKNNDAANKKNKAIIADKGLTAPKNVKNGTKAQASNTVKTFTKNIATTHKKDNILFLSKYVVKNFLFPSIFFCFSKKKCHNFAKKLYRMYLTEHEKKEVMKIITAKIAVLPYEVKKLPQVEEVIKYLSNGIAIHHSGLLPFLKELTEIIFSLNLIRIIIATETFSVGVNFPAKSVVFLSLRKRDDFGQRLLASGEFMQMSGRAGRRGKDKKGIVLISKDNCSEFEIKSLIDGKAFIRSRFFLSFSMILRMLRINIRIEDVLKASFSEDTGQKDVYKSILKLEQLKKGLFKYTKLQTDKKSVNSDDKNGHNANKTDTNNLTSNKTIEQKPLETNQYGYCSICIDLETYIEKLHIFYKQNKQLVQNYFDDSKNTTKENLFDIKFVLRDFTSVTPIFIQDKTFVSYCEKDSFALFTEKTYNTETRKLLQDFTYYQFSDNCKKTTTSQEKTQSDIDKNYGIKCSEKTMKDIDKQRLSKYDNNKKEKHFYIKDILYIKKQDKPFFDYKSKHISHKISELEVTKIFDELQDFICINCPSHKLHYNTQLRHKLLSDRIAEIKKDLSDENLQLFYDYNKKVEFLIKNEYIDDNHNLMLKGRVACELKTADEIFMTEMIINNSFKQMESAYIMKFASGFVNFETCDECDEEMLEIINNTLNTIQKRVTATHMDSAKTDEPLSHSIDSTIQKRVTATHMDSAKTDEPLSHSIDSTIQKRVTATHIDSAKTDEPLSHSFDNSLETGMADKKSHKHSDSSIFRYENQKAHIDSYEFKFGNAYCNAIFDWCSGVSLLDIIKRNRIAEGTLVRVVLRLEEFCKEMITICEIINDMETKSKIEDCQKMLKRDLTMCASLYFD